MEITGESAQTNSKILRLNCLKMKGEPRIPEPQLQAVQAVCDTPVVVLAC